ncbi:MAG: AAA family ATPase, partial [Candidatus Omnitrophica bacterium]|nr:AAA family ATPase [Candidatus Omnitrophota bacterium]
MLVSLHVSNFVLIDDCRIEFHPGLNVLTGETGAGKSILVGAMSLLVGERGSSDSLRNPRRDAIVEAVFELPPDSDLTRQLQALLSDSGVPWEDGALILSRVLSSNGRHRIFINNAQCLLKLLKDAGALLMDLHGQHEHQSLLQKSSYRPLLDRFGDYGDVLEDYRRVYGERRDALAQLAALEEDERERRRREDALRFQTQE